MKTGKTLVEEFQQLVADIHAENMIFPEISDTDSATGGPDMDELANELAELESELKATQQEESDLRLTQNMLEAKLNELEHSLNKKNEHKKMYQELKMREVFAEANPSQTDSDFITSIEKKLEAYKGLTGVMWNVKNCSKTSLSGYIFNPATKKVMCFEHYTTNTEGDDIADILWKKIEQTCWSKK